MKRINEIIVIIQRIQSIDVFSLTCFPNWEKIRFDRLYTTNNNEMIKGEQKKIHHRIFNLRAFL